MLFLVWLDAHVKKDTQDEYVLKKRHTTLGRLCQHLDKHIYTQTDSLSHNPLTTFQARGITSQGDEKKKMAKR